MAPPSKPGPFDRPPPPIPARAEEMDDPARGSSQQRDEHAAIDWVDKALRRRWLPRLRLPGFIRRRLPELPPEVRYRWQVITGLIQVVLSVVFFFAAVAIFISLLFDITVREPKTAQDVLRRVETPKDVSYSVETVRIKRIDGATLRLDTLRGLQVDLRNRRFRAQAFGLRPTGFRMAGDGRLLVFHADDQSAATVVGCQPQACAELPRYPYYKGKTPPPYPPFEQYKPVVAEDLIPLAGHLVTNKATVDGERGWLLTWKPTKEILLRLLNVDLFRDFSTYPQDDWEAIRRGDFEISHATATVTRRKPRLHQLELVLSVNKARLRILVTYRLFNSKQLEDFELKPQWDDEQEVF